MRFILSDNLHELVLAKVGGLKISIDSYLVGLIEDDLGRDDFMDFKIDYDIVSSGDPICDEIASDENILKRYDSDDFIEI